MDDIYEWLFDHYALPQLKTPEAGQSEVLRALAERLSLSQTECLCLLDLADNIRLQWGAESFAMGLWFGLHLSEPSGRPRDSQWLTHFLP